MERRNRILIAYVAIAIVLVIGGIVWQGEDYRRIRALDYRTHSRTIHHQEEIDIPQCIARAKTLMQNDRLHLIDEYRSGQSSWEIIAQTQRFWLFSDAYDKITIVDAISREKGSSREPVRAILVFSGSIRTGSRVFRWLVFLIVMLIFAVSFKRDRFPHVYPGGSDEKA